MKTTMYLVVGNGLSVHLDAWTVEGGNPEDKTMCGLFATGYIYLTDRQLRYWRRGHRASRFGQYGLHLNLLCGTCGYVRYAQERDNE